MRILHAHTTQPSHTHTHTQASKLKHKQATATKNKTMKSLQFITTISAEAPTPMATINKTKTKKKNVFSRLIQVLPRSRNNQISKRDSSSRSLCATECSSQPCSSRSLDSLFFGRGARFDDNLRVHDTITIDDYTKEELKASWYNDDEFQQIAKAAAKEVKKLEQGEILKDRKYCARGLENHCYAGKLQKKVNRKKVLQAVLAEQRLQRLELGRYEGAIDIAQVSQKLTSGCQMWARSAGLRDEVAAAKCRNG